jgi:ferredoxin-thioredoxin reductase catalytic chain
LDIKRIKSRRLLEFKRIKMKTEQLYQALKKSQEAKDIYFNKDKDLVFELLESLLLNKERYGYMACPCRLACGDKEKDKDIVCPCDYRQPDLEEFGACFCGLYISLALNNNEIESEYIPERRPPEKIF